MEHTPKVGFVFSTKDRVEFSRRSLASIDSEGGFDLIWVDGSDTPEGKALPSIILLKNCRLVEVHSDIRGGPDNAIRFGLKRLLSLGYDYCGLIENDIVLEQGWFAKIMDLFVMAAADGYIVGATTVRNLSTRVLLYRPYYTLNWATGAGMLLFTRKAAKVVLATYTRISSKKIAAYCKSRLHKDLSHVWEIWVDKEDWLHGCDWAYSLQLFAHGIVSVGSIPSMARNIDVDIERTLRTSYVLSFPGAKPHDPLEVKLKISPLAALRLLFCDDHIPLAVFLAYTDLKWRISEMPRRIRRSIPRSVKVTVRRLLGRVRNENGCL